MLITQLYLEEKNPYDSKQKFIRYLLSKGFKYNDILELLEGGEYEFD